MEDSYERYGAKFFMFYDDTFTVNKAHVLGVCDELIKRRLNKKITTYVNTSANTTDREMLDRMAETGLVEISMGVETGNPDIMQSIKKGATLQAYKKFYKRKE